MTIGQFYFFPFHPGFFELTKTMNAKYNDLLVEIIFYFMNM